MTTGKFGYGQQGPNDSSSDFNKFSFLINQMLARTRTMVLVEVMAVTNDGGVAPVGFVDVRPLVNQTDGNNNASPHGTIFNLPYTRIQGGTNAIIMDPKVGDLGWAAIADRDISAVKVNKKRSNPGSFRRFALADGVYIGGILNGAPTQYVRFSDDGIEVVSPTKVTAGIDGTMKLEVTPTSVSMVFGSNSIVVNAAGITFNGPTFFNGVAQGPTAGGTVNFGSADIVTTGGVQADNVQATDNVQAGPISLTGHVHGGVQTGGGSSGPPVP